MKKVWFLSTCSTCKSMIQRYDLEKGFELQDIKKEPVSEMDLSRWLKNYTAIELFNKRARKAKELPKPVEQMSSEEIKNLIIEEYTFLNRPVIEDGEYLFVGNSKNTKAALDKHFNIDG